MVRKKWHIVPKIEHDYYEHYEYWKLPLGRHGSCGPINGTESSAGVKNSRLEGAIHLCTLDWLFSANDRYYSAAVTTKDCNEF